ncbi:MAG: membrane protein insertase YidC [Candidatus Kapaibacteriales bacterium]
MDRNSIIAIILIAIVLTIWTLYLSIHQAPPPSETKQTFEDTSRKVLTKALNDTLRSAPEPDSIKLLQKYGTFFSRFVAGNENNIKIETDLVTIHFTSKGATIKKWILKKYKSWNGYPTQLIWAKGGTPSLIFNTRENLKLDDRDLNYSIIGLDSNNIRISGSDSISFLARIEIEPGKYIAKRFFFYANKYHFRTEIVLENVDDYITTKGYSIQWTDGLRYQEVNSIDESGLAKAIASFNREIEELDASGNQPVTITPSGKLDFVAVKIKYFAAAIIPVPSGSYDGTIRMSGYRSPASDEGVIEKYNLSIPVPYRGGLQERTFDFYIGPIDYSIVQEYGISDVVDFGWRFMVRPIGEFFMLPIFKLIYYFVGNYGISIIIFALIMKILLYPLSISQMRSAKKMQLLSPELTKIREKFKDDPKKMQAETMKLYSEYGINPMGGCLPLLLQLPILYALWAVLRTAIELRQAPFVLWISDLSLPDYILNLPISFFGIKHISGLAVLMGVTLYFQQKMTTTDPRQKALIIIMPLMFVFLFSNFPSGLNLYYFMFNLFSIAHQYYLNKLSKKKLTLEDLKRMPKKEGWLQRKIREAQEIAEAQGRSLPGQSYIQRKKQPIRRKKPRKK